MAKDLDDENFDEEGFEAEQLPDPNIPEIRKLANERKRFLREKIELRKMAADLDLSYQDYLEMFGGETGS